MLQIGPEEYGGVVGYQMIVRNNANDVIPAGADFGRSINSSGEAPIDAVTRMAGGFMMTQVLHAAAQAGIADFIADGRPTVEEIASALHLEASALERFLRMMVVLDLLAQVEPQAFSLAPAGHLLRSDHPQSMRDRILYLGAVNYPVASDVMHSLRTGGPAFDNVFGVPFFDYLGQKPFLGRTFNQLMQRATEARVTGILSAGDFSRARYIVDIGGGNGSLLSAILASYDEITGAVYDLPAVIADARERLRGSDTGSRIKLIEGDLFAGPYPAGADLYILSNIIHDWNDVQAGKILAHCAQVMARDSELLLIEETLPELVTDSPSTVANDYSMLLLTGGMERSEAQYRALLERSGLKLSKITPIILQGSDPRRKGRWSLMYCHAK